MLPARASDSDSSSGQAHCTSPLARAFSRLRAGESDSDRELIDTGAAPKRDADRWRGIMMLPGRRDSDPGVGRGPICLTCGAPGLYYYYQ